MKKRLLFLSWRDIHHRKAGGAEVFTHELMSRLDKDIYDITHISPSSTNRSGELNPSQETIEGINYLRRGNWMTVIFYSLVYYIRNGREIDYVIDQCNTHRFFTPLWVKSSKRIFFIHQMTKEIWTMNLPNWIGAIGQVLEGYMTWIYRNSHLILTVSDSTKKDLMAFGCKEDYIVVLPEGIDFMPWQAEDLEKKEEGLFTYVGRYSSYKGIDSALEAFCRIHIKYPETRFQVIGKKNEKYIEEVLEPIRQRYDIEEDVITYLGFVSEEEKLTQMSRSQCLVFPSLREGWGLTVTEAAAVGTPSIVYRSPGLVDAVNHGKAGYITRVNNVFELQRLMEDALMDYDTYERIRFNAYEFAKKFNWDNTATAFSEVV